MDVRKEKTKVTFNANSVLYAEFKKRCIDLRTTPTALFARMMHDVIQGNYPVENEAQK